MAVPVEWLGNFLVNTGAAKPGDQSLPHVIGLANGNILVVWRDEESALNGGLPAIVAKLYDAEGRVVRNTFFLDSATLHVGNIDIAATNDGGWVVVSARAGPFSDPNRSEIEWRRWDADGVNIDVAQVSAEATAAEALSEPSITYDQ